MAAYDLLTDEAVAARLIKDANDHALRFSGYGMESTEARPERKPKPNTTFLRNIIKTTENHNTALLAKEAAESQARLQEMNSEAEQKNEREEQRRRRQQPDPQDVRRRQLNGIATILRGRQGRDMPDSGLSFEKSFEPSQYYKSDADDSDERLHHHHYNHYHHYHRSRGDRRSRRAHSSSKKEGGGRHHSNSNSNSRDISRRRRRRSRSPDAGAARKHRVRERSPVVKRFRAIWVARSPSKSRSLDGAPLEEGKSLLVGGKSSPVKHPSEDGRKGGQEESVRDDEEKKDVSQGREIHQDKGTPKHQDDPEHQDEEEQPDEGEYRYEHQDEEGDEDLEDAEIQEGHGYEEDYKFQGGDEGEEYYEDQEDYEVEDDHDIPADGNPDSGSRQEWKEDKEGEGKGQDNDESDSFVGPHPSGWTPINHPRPRVRGRGTTAKASGTNARLSSSHDPHSGLQLAPLPRPPAGAAAGGAGKEASEEGKGEEEGRWVESVEAYRERQKWRAQGAAARLRGLGFSDEQVRRRWEGGRGGEGKSLEDVKWDGCGKERQWDRGKAVGGDGFVSTGPEWAKGK